MCLDSSLLYVTSPVSEVFDTLINLIFHQIQGAVFDLPEEIAKELLNKELPPGNTITKITKVSSENNQIYEG